MDETLIMIFTAILIFLARIIDVSMGTVRIVFISKGKKLFSAFIGFFEVLIWIVAIGQIMKNLTSPIYYVAYAAGFATGTYLGMVIEEKIAVGYVMLRIITRKKATELIKKLKGKGINFTKLDAKNSHGTHSNILYVLIKRKDLDYVSKTIKKFNPNAFYSIEDIKAISENGLSKNSKKHSALKRSGLFAKRAK